LHLKATRANDFAKSKSVARALDDVHDKVASMDVEFSNTTDPAVLARASAWNRKLSVSKLRLIIMDYNTGSDSLVICPVVNRLYLVVLTLELFLQIGNGDFSHLLG
jgi:hypothetical protein